MDICKKFLQECILLAIIRWTQFTHCSGNISLQKEETKTPAQDIRFGAPPLTR